MQVNPRIHLLLVLALAVAIPWMRPLSLLLLALLLLAWHVHQGRAALRGLGRGLWRLKWLFLAIFLLYLWIPTGEGGETMLSEAGRRSAILALMFAGIHTLVFSLGPATLATLLSSSLRPLDRIGLPGALFGRRLAVLVSVVTRDREQLHRRHQAARESGDTKRWLSYIPELLAAEIRKIEEDARSGHRPTASSGEGAGALPALGRRDGLVLIAGLGLILLLLL